MLSDGGDIVFLEEADGGNTGGAGCKTEFGILHVYSAECENGNFRMTGLAEGVETGGLRFGRGLFFEYRGEESQGGLVGGGMVDFFWGMTRDGDGRRWW